jgi:predicted GNAT family acetyltransferase
MFSKPKASPQQIFNGRFELERDGKTAYLEYSLGAGVLVLSHTEIPKELRGQGVSAVLAKSALEYARQNNLRVDVVCDSVAQYIKTHPEYSDLVIR